MEGIRMKTWNTVSLGDKKLFDAISLLLVGNLDLLTVLFNQQQPKLNGSSRNILRAASGLCASDFLLIRVALDLWSGSGGVTIDEIVDADQEICRVIVLPWSI
jgi:hypothetical protein